MNHSADADLPLQAPLQKKVILLDYFTSLYQIYTMIIHYYNNPSYYIEHSKIEEIVAGKPLVITRIHHQQIRNKIYILNI